MQDFEKLGVFYLGREYDPAEKKPKDALLLYDSKDLVTHAVCVGMTGSGKTGLCVGLLEEAAIDGIPSLIIDPKGDLANLLLTFPEMRPGDFLPWINEDDARKKGLPPEVYAEKQAALWKKGLAEWGQDGTRIRRLKDAADFAIYTPGSGAGIPLSILKSFEAPERIVIDDTELLGERIGTTVTGLLGLLGVDADPIQSREHILLSTILHSFWVRGRDIDLAGLIQAIQSPPVTRIGVFDIESFFPSKDRFSLAMKLNNLLAAPGFSAWLEGEPLEIDRMLFIPQGKPKVSIISIAHLNDAERMFFVSLLLTRLLGWMRNQSGTTSLRTLFYMDEIFGYFPPVANPPSKAPLLTLLKQARAFGLGIVLATQNPVDLDYKGLSNTGTWFIGRLQTERDRERVLDGLEGAGSGAGLRFDRKQMERTLSGLGQRVFLMNNVHEDEPVVFESRWVMSYLRGPLTRNQIRQLMAPVKSLQAEPAAAQTAKPFSPGSVAVPEPVSPPVSSRPALPPGIAQYFMPVSVEQPDGDRLFYEPMVLAAGKIFYTDAKSGVAAQQDYSLLARYSGGSTEIDWDNASETELRENDLEKVPYAADVLFGELPPDASSEKNYARWANTFRDWLYRNRKLSLYKSSLFGVVSEPGESERDFRIRLRQSAREKRDALVERIRQKYAGRIATLEERLRRAEQAVEREKEQSGQQKLQTAISFGAALLTALTGRKKVSQSSLGRAATTARSAGRIFKEGKDVERASENVEELRRRLADLQQLFEEETDQITASTDPLTETLEEHTIRPKKTNISASSVSLVWMPYWQNPKGGLTAAWREV
jgi:hypothetical protein